MLKLKIWFIVFSITFTVRGNYNVHFYLTASNNEDFMVQAVQESVQILFTIIAVYRSDLGLLPKWRNNRSNFEPAGSFGC